MPPLTADIADLLRLLGEKELELYLLRRQLAQLQEATRHDHGLRAVAPLDEAKDPQRHAQ